MTQPTTETFDLALLLQALRTYRRGDFSVRLPTDWEGLAGKIADTFNETVEETGRITEDITRVRHTVVQEGNLRQRVPTGASTEILPWSRLASGGKTSVYSSSALLSRSCSRTREFMVITCGGISSGATTSARSNSSESSSR